jgi:hypothetical protein
MATLTKKRPVSGEQLRETEYRGRQTKTGNSSGFRFEGALFKSHPEFNGEVTAHVIAPGRLLVTAASSKPAEQDSVMAAFLAFLAQDIAQAPGAVRPLDSALTKRIDRLTEGIEISPDAALGDEAIL